VRRQDARRHGERGPRAAHRTSATVARTGRIPGASARST
jgi:hypothetical protein